MTNQSSTVITNLNKKPKALIAEAGYDTIDNGSYLISHNIMPFIAPNPRARQNAIQRADISIGPDRKFFCKAGIELSCWGRETRRGRVKFRCGLYGERGAGCLFKGSCFKGKYGPTFYLKEDRGVQDIMEAVRVQKGWSRVYEMRTAIERLFSILKGSHSLDALRFKGIRNTSIHVFMSISAHLVRVVCWNEAQGRTFGCLRHTHGMRSSGQQG